MLRRTVFVALSCVVVVSCTGDYKHSHPSATTSPPIVPSVRTQDGHLIFSVGDCYTGTIAGVDVGVFRRNSWALVWAIEAQRGAPVPHARSFDFGHPPTGYRTTTAPASTKLPPGEYSVSYHGPEGDAYLLDPSSTFTIGRGGALDERVYGTCPGPA